MDDSNVYDLHFVSAEQRAQHAAGSAASALAYAGTDVKQTPLWMVAPHCADAEADASPEHASTRREAGMRPKRGARISC